MKTLQGKFNLSDDDVSILEAAIADKKVTLRDLRGYAGIMPYGFTPEQFADWAMEEFPGMWESREDLLETISHDDHYIVGDGYIIQIAR
ncbi:MAG: hypothetical protein WC373_05675 [Smithella sp.]|jgi:hypothetical protein